jgi:hypothetical protein
MALLVATAGRTPRVAHRTGGVTQAAARTSRPSHGGHGDSPVSAPTTTTTTAAVGDSTPQSGSADVASSLRSTGNPSAATAPPSSTSNVTATTAPPATTTTTVPVATSPSGELAADRTQNQGYLDPPVQTSNKYGFTGTGAMQISVVWSGSTYLSLQVTCPSGDQSSGGTAAMEALLPDASGSCFATVTEPASESTSLTYAITIGPAGD